MRTASSMETRRTTQSESQEKQSDGAPCHAHLLRAREYVAAGAHGASDEHRLADELVVHGDERVVGGEGAGAALAVHEQCLEFAVDHVLLHLADGMGVRGWG